jgi:hypothetical protein
MLSADQRLKVLRLAVDSSPTFGSGKSPQDILDRARLFEEYVDAQPGSEGASTDAAARPVDGEGEQATPAQ